MTIKKIYGVLFPSILVVALLLRFILSYTTDPFLKNGITISSLFLELGVQVIYWIIVMQVTFSLAARFFEDEEWVDYLEEHNIFEGADPLKNYYYEYFTGIHHSVGGSFLAIGWLYGNELLFLHGLFVEMSYETFDTFRVLIGWLRKQPDCPTAMLVILGAHHLPGMSLIVPISLCCLSSVKIQIIASSLLSAGAISVVVLLGSKVLNLATPEAQKTMINLTVFNIVFFVLFRFVIATPAAIFLIIENWGSLFGYTFTFGFTLITSFNLIILQILGGKVWKLLKGKKKEERQKSSLELVRAMPSRYLLEGVVHQYVVKNKKRDWFSSPDLLRADPDRRKQLKQTRSWRNSRPTGILFPTLSRSNFKTDKISANDKKDT